MSGMNIYQRMSAITKEISTVAKNLNVGTGQSAYKAVGEADVLSAVKPIEEKYGVYSYPYSRRTTLEDTIVFKNYKGEEKSNIFMRIETIYRFVNVDTPTEFIDITTYGDGIDSQDKAPGKAMTYGDKYALLKAYKIQTGDDPDQNKSEEMKVTSDYPSRDEMINEIKNHYPEGAVRDKLLEATKKKSIEEFSEALLKTVYNKVKK